MGSLEMGEGEASAELGSREEALRAVLHCRERKHTMPFRVSVPTSARPPGPDSAPGADAPKMPGKPKAPRASGGTEGKPAKPAGKGNFEKDMLGNLLELAAAQRAKRAQQKHTEKPNGEA